MTVNPLRSAASVRRTAVALLCAGALFTSAACSSSKSATGSSAGASGSAAVNNLPATIKIESVRDLTGAAAFAGLAANKGIELAVGQINDQGYLGSSKITLNEDDTAYSNQTAAAKVAQAISDRSYAAILGPVTSAQALAVAPLAQKAKMPIIFTQSGSDGVVVGDYTFRATAPMASYYGDLAGAFLKSKGVKTLSVIYDSSNVTISQLVKNVLPAAGTKFGFTVKDGNAIQSTTQDFSSSVNKVVGEKSDALAMLVVGAANARVMTALRQAGYDKPVVAQAGAGTGNLKPSAAAGVGVTWPTDFTPSQTAADGPAFVKAFQAKYNELPSNYAAEGFDAAWLLARGIKAAGSADRSAIQAGLAKVTKAGFTGAMGAITFNGNDMRVPGVLAQWDGTQEQLLSTPSS